MARPLTRTHAYAGWKGLANNAMQLTRGRLEPSGNTIIGRVIVNEGKVVRPSQLIASVSPA